MILKKLSNDPGRERFRKLIMEDPLLKKAVENSAKLEKRSIFLRGLFVLGIFVLMILGLAFWYPIMLHVYAFWFGWSP